MARGDGFGLVLPACLVVAACGCVARVEPGEGTGSETNPSTTDSTGVTSTSNATTTLDPSTSTLDPSTTTLDPSTTADDEATAGPIELPDCGAIGFVAECEDEDGCRWRMGEGCIVDCAQITDEAQCSSLPHCEWLGDCDFPGPI